jgi:nuclear transport factor 2 (NTF2) superfamily protein
MTESTDIWMERGLLEKARGDFQEAAMHDYNRDVYYPAMKALRERCAAIGHRPQNKWHDNGLGWMWCYCNQCGKRLDVMGPDS